MRNGLLVAGVALLGLGLVDCAKDEVVTSECAPDQLDRIASAEGVGRAFSPDPAVRSGRTDLSPNASLDAFAIDVPLSNLGGHGVLEGTYVDVRNGKNCNGWFGAYSPVNQFSYGHPNFRFQESMTYYFGDRYQSNVSSLGYLVAPGPIQIYAHCMDEDNAYFVRYKDSNGAVVEEVCLGDSTSTPGASLADDASVSVHELQHGATVDLYSAIQNLNRLWYDEAGSLNEAVSDFMAMTYLQPLLTPAFDGRLFARWALGTFSSQSGVRGAHKCPAYDPSYPNCAQFPAFSATNNTISYVYPDGLGWPYAKNFVGPGYASQAFASYPAQEEIHNAGMLFEGALWDVYDAIRTNHGGDHGSAQVLSSKLVLEVIKHLPKPTSSQASPVTFREFASQMLTYAGAVGLTAADQTSLSDVLTARGLLGGALLPANWAAVGPGNAVSPGLQILDNPTKLKSWLYKLTRSPESGSLVPQDIRTGLNSQLDPGELVAIWFDIQNTQAQTAGGLQVTVTSLDPDVTFEPGINRGTVGTDNSQIQIRYGKVNGSAIVTSLTSANPTYTVGTGNSYFRTNPYFDNSFTTAIWMRVKSTAAHSKTVSFQVEALPSNGAASVVTFQATIN